MWGSAWTAVLLSACLALSLADDNRAEDNEEESNEEWYDDFVPEASRSHTRMYESPDKSYKMYQNLWYHNSQYYAVVADPANTTVADAMSANQLLVYLPTVDAEKFLSNVQPAWIGGTTLALDLVFPAFPTNLGHWTEILLPMLGALQDGRWREHVQFPGQQESLLPDRILLVNTFEGDIVNWIDEMLAVALGVDSPHDLPPIVDAADISGLEKRAWLGFENYILVTDRYTASNKPYRPQSSVEVVARAAERAQKASLGQLDDTSRSPSTGCPLVNPTDWPFALRNQEAADLFRKRAYRAARLQPPSEDPLAAIPKQITVVSAAGGEVVTNKADLVTALWEVAKDNGWTVRLFTATPEAPFASHVAAMAQTGVIVARHGSTLASSFLLPSGAAAYELLPYNWEWRDLNQIYRNMTRSTGRLHHFAWRATDPKWAQYAEPQDQSRYAHFRPSECTSRTCLTVHAKAGLKVDVEAIKEDFRSLLPMLNGASDADGCSDVYCKIKKNCRNWPPAE